MDQLKKVIRRGVIGLYLSDVWKLNFDQIILPLTYLCSLFEYDVYLKATILLCAILHKFFVDTYITDRFLSIGLIFITIITNLVRLNIIYSIFFIVILKDTICYKRVKERRELEAKYFNVVNDLLQVYSKHEINDNVYNLDDEDEDDEIEFGEEKLVNFSI